MPLRIHHEIDLSVMSDQKSGRPARAEPNAKVTAMTFP